LAHARETLGIAELVESRLGMVEHLQRRVFLPAHGKGLGEQ
jgi:hypothetical protein